MGGGADADNRGEAPWSVDAGAGTATIACCGNDNAARAYQAVEKCRVERVLFAHLSYRVSLTERGHTGLSLAVGIVEDILKAHRVDSCSVLIDVCGVDEHRVALHGIAHYTDVGLRGNTDVRRVVATARRNA